VATAEERGVGGVDDGVDVECGDVGLEEIDAIEHGSISGHLLHRTGPRVISHDEIRGIDAD
jgi:hypothetical protein